MDAETLAKLRLLAPLLNQLSLSADAECFYEWLSGGLLWTDEIPDLSSVPPDTFQALRGVLWYRTALILGEPEKRDQALWPKMESLFPGWSGLAQAQENAALWLEAQKLFPHWPGFAPARRSGELR